jgi:nitrite reductase (NADH) small subunit
MISSYLVAGPARVRYFPMERWAEVARIDDVPPGESRELVAEGRVIALFNVQGKFYALDGVCPHQGGPLGKGRLEGCIVTCPWHGWQFDVTTGQHQSSHSLFHARLDVRVEEDRILVNLDPPAQREP